MKVETAWNRQQATFLSTGTVIGNPTPHAHGTRLPNVPARYVTRAATLSQREAVDACV